MIKIFIYNMDSGEVRMFEPNGTSLEAFEKTKKLKKDMGNGNFLFEIDDEEFLNDETESLEVFKDILKNTLDITPEELSTPPCSI